MWLGWGGRKKALSQSILLKSHRIIIKKPNLTCVCVTSYAKEMTHKKRKEHKKENRKVKVYIKKAFVPKDVTKLTKQVGTKIKHTM